MMIDEVRIGSVDRRFLIHRLFPYPTALWLAIGSFAAKSRVDSNQRLLSSLVSLGWKLLPRTNASNSCAIGC